VKITLHPRLQRFIDEKVRCGRYASVEEAVNDLLEQVRAQEKLDIKELQAEMDIGLAEADRGEFVEFTAEDVIAAQRKARKNQLRSGTLPHSGQRSGVARRS
jgi:antitoxin ParD1/3/4